MRRIELVGFLVVAGIVAAMAAPALNPALGVIFPADKARELVRQCGRDTPHPVTGTWLPTASQVARLEQIFPKAFTQTVTARGFDRREGLVEQMDKLARQYGGIIIGKRRLIYVNGFPPPPPFVWLGKNKLVFDWRHQAQMVCDGGPWFFGAEFDPGTGTFVHFAFNGVA